jgi:hypothetical protein
MAEAVQPPAEEPAAKRKRTNKNKACLGWCEERTSPWCRMEEEDNPQWDHRPNWKVHRLKWHSTPEEQAEQKFFMGSDDDRFIPNCFRCSEGFWTQNDIVEHLEVLRMQDATEEHLVAPQWHSRKKTTEGQPSAPQWLFWLVALIVRSN